MQALSKLRYNPTTLGRFLDLEAPLLAHVPYGLNHHVLNSNARDIWRNWGSLRTTISYAWASGTRYYFRFVTEAGQVFPFDRVAPQLTLIENVCVHVSGHVGLACHCSSPIVAWKSLKN